MYPPFRNQPYVDFADPDVAKRMRLALENVAGQLGKEYKLLVGGKWIESSEKFESRNPSEKEQVVGVFNRATADIVNDAVEAANRYFPVWANHSPEDRAIVLFKAAELARKRIFELTAWEVFEVGKPWIEGYADVCEAIDFMEFYGREMIRYSESSKGLTPLPGEYNELRYIPLGVGAIIPPWNFPGAILVGMTTSALVTGNTVVLKPASDSPTIGYQFVKILLEAGLPPEAINFIPGPGGKIGDALVSHPKIRFISFTGSKEVGCRINELAAKISPGQKWIKRVVLEMGGKDFVAADETADTESVAKGIVVSAFGFQGQKCSAGSRAIIHKDIYDEVVDKVLGLTRELTVGPVHKDNYHMGPVVNAAAEEKIMHYIDIGKSEAKLAIGGERLSDTGYFIAPTVFVDVPDTARIAQEEIFGPVVSVIKANDYEDIVRIANGTDYGLTGAFYSKDRFRIYDAKKRLFAGNLYINRKCTAALVGVHPFGGFNMSGTDSKAGGRDYLLLFLQAKAISEKI